MIKKNRLSDIVIPRERTLARIRSVKVLNYALSGEDSRDRCLRFVDASGLKSLFPLFMGKVIYKPIIAFKYYPLILSRVTKNSKNYTKLHLTSQRMKVNQSSGLLLWNEN